MNKSDKRADIMQAALELIAERGFHDAPMSEISEKAGVAAGTVYRYFANKEELINELFGNLEKSIKDYILDGYPSDKPVRERFFYVLGEMIRYLLAHPLYFRYMEQYFNSPYGISKRRDKLLRETIDHDSHDKHSLFIRIFEDGISQHILKDIPLVVLFALTLGPMIFVIRDHTLGFIVLDEPLIQQITEACWDAIKR